MFADSCLRSVLLQIFISARWLRDVLRCKYQRPTISIPKISKNCFCKEPRVHDFALRVLSTGSDAVAVEAILASDNTHPVSIWDVFPSPLLRGRVLLRPPKPQRHVGGGQSGGAGFLAGFGSGFCPAPPEIHRNLQI